MATKHEKMVEACAERTAQTKGTCLEECAGIGWCAHVYDSTRSKKTGKKRDARAAVPVEL